MNRHKRNLALAVLFLTAFVGTCFVGVGSAQTPVFYGALRQGILGQTVCNLKGDVAIIINDSYDFDSTELFNAVRHENIHVAQISRNGGCQKANLVYKTKAIELETEAYCPELRDRLRMAHEPGQIYQDFIEHMHRIYGIPRKMSVADVVRVVEQVCPTGRFSVPP